VDGGLLGGSTYGRLAFCGGKLVSFTTFLALSVLSQSIDHAGFEHFQGAVVWHWLLAWVANGPGEQWTSLQ